MISLFFSGGVNDGRKARGRWSWLPLWGRLRPEGRVRARRRRVGGSTFSASFSETYIYRRGPGPRDTHPPTRRPKCTALNIPSQRNVIVTMALSDCTSHCCRTESYLVSHLHTPTCTFIDHPFFLQQTSLLVLELFCSPCMWRTHSGYRQRSRQMSIVGVGRVPLDQSRLHPQVSSDQHNKNLDDVYVMIYCISHHLCSPDLIEGRRCFRQRWIRKLTIH